MTSSKSLLDILPIELLSEVAAQTPLRGLKALRAVCRALAWASSPVLFSRVTIQIQYLRYPKNLSLLIALAAGEHDVQWSRYVHTLKIIPGAYDASQAAIAHNTDDISGAELKLLVIAALSRMKNVTTVHWRIDNGSDRWGLQAISRWLILQHKTPAIRLSLESTFYDDLPKIPPIVELSLSSTSLESFLLFQVARMIPQTYKTLTTFIRAGPEIWLVLLRCSPARCPRLQVIIAGEVSSHFVDYLGTYSGARRLILRHVDGASHPDVVNPFAYDFYQNLELHSRSLRELVCTARFQSSWSFSVTWAPAICRLHNLIKLELSVDEENIFNVSPADNAVTVLLCITAHLSHLQTLTITFTQSNILRIPRSGAGALYGDYGRRMLNGIKSAVLDFRLRCSPGRMPTRRAIVQVGFYVFKLTRIALSADGHGGRFVDPLASGLYELLPTASHIVKSGDQAEVEMYAYIVALDV
ncbi:hypothetical protein C8F01DRAFT_1366551 [Mycena amicta]|nr:hypothetical protein C8F01DRAFT_1366551 [Mycena amicta]